MKKILVFGGGGYVGGILIPQLVDNGYSVRVFDTFWYGTAHLSEMNHVELFAGDVRDIKLVRESLADVEYVLHLACISNDASFELDENLSTTVNFDSFEPLVTAAKLAGVRRFVFASSSSVYGVSDKPNVTEDHPLVPLTLYNKYKGLCEPLLFKHVDSNFEGVVFRPATVCGYSPRQRLDLSVNILTNFAVNKGMIKVFGGTQLRPNLHIKDYAGACLALLEADADLVNREIFNVGFQNYSISDLAGIVKTVVESDGIHREVEIEFTESDDNRSYHINSDKIFERINFRPEFTVEDAVLDLCRAFQQGLLPNSFKDEHYFNVRLMQKLGVK